MRRFIHASVATLGEIGGGGCLIEVRNELE